MSTATLPEQCYYVECPTSGVRMSATFTATEHGQVLPPCLEDITCLSSSCELGKHTLLPISRENAEALMDGSDDDAVVDTSQPYFLDLIKRIDDEITP